MKPHDAPDAPRPGRQVGPLDSRAEILAAARALADAAPALDAATIGRVAALLRNHRPVSIGLQKAA